QSLVVNNRVTESTQDNFWQVTDLRSNLLPKLSGAERAILDQGIAVVAAEEQKPDPDAEVLLTGHKEALEKMLRDGATFAPQARPTDSSSCGQTVPRATTVRCFWTAC